MLLARRLLKKLLTPLLTKPPLLKTRWLLKLLRPKAMPWLLKLLRPKAMPWLLKPRLLKLPRLPKPPRPSKPYGLPVTTLWS